ncbi:MAG: sugar transferase [Anaerohalosphaeraceae bacterium]
MQLLICPELFGGNNRPGPWSHLGAMLPNRELLWAILLARQTRMGWGVLNVLPPSDGDKKAVSIPGQFKGRIPVNGQITDSKSSSPYFLIHHGRFLTTLSSRVFDDLASHVDADMITIEAVPELSAFYETACLTGNGDMVGISRPYQDGIEPQFQMTGHPHHLLIHQRLLSRCPSLMKTSDPEQWLDIARQAGARCLYFKVAGVPCDLESEQGVLSVLATEEFTEAETLKSSDLPASVRVVGPILWGRNVQVEPDVIITGPTVLCDGVKIHSGAVVKHSVIGPNLDIACEQVVRNRVLWTQQDCETDDSCKNTSSIETEPSSFIQAFRHWPTLSYARMIKRLADILFSLVVLVLASPIFLVVALIIKLTSSGPIFYPARRQGHHGVEFNCMKFRTMIVQADALQDRLRVVNQVDGPQFKIEDDPRITGVGKFLRDTCIDEIPQFINVLLGQMSVVGPRPSPDQENRTCPAWRDARLSVRPGITGLWQISRTRKIGMDFQEWVYYDMEYVRNLSLWMDVRICVRTVMHLVHQFLKQFG